MTEIFILVKQESTNFIVNYWSDFTIAVLSILSTFSNALVHRVWRKSCCTVSPTELCSTQHTGEKAAFRMLMKLTPDLCFMNCSVLLSTMVDQTKISTL
jgi:hypothetical protein